MAQMSTRQCSFAEISMTCMLWRTEPSGTMNLRISTRPLEKVSILIAEGKRISREISLAAVKSGLMAMDRFSSSRIKFTSLAYSGFLTLAMV